MSFSVLASGLPEVGTQITYEMVQILVKRMTASDATLIKYMLKDLKLFKAGKEATYFTVFTSRPKV